MTERLVPGGIFGLCFNAERNGAPASASPVAAITDHARLAWLLRAISVQGTLPIAPEEVCSARRTVVELNNLADERLAEWIEDADFRGIRLTARGRRLAVAFYALWEEQQKLLTRFGTLFSDDLRLLERVAVRTSARNQFVARVETIGTGRTGTEVILSLAGGHRLLTRITAQSVAALGLRPGREVLTLIKASSVLLLETADQPGYGEHNKIAGTVADIGDAPPSQEIFVDLGAGLTAVALAGAPLPIDWKKGDKITLAIDPSAIMIGIMG
jgi:molybdate transport system regulatory protein